MAVGKQLIRATTADGVRLQLTRVVDDHAPTRGAVVMQHGLGSNGAVFLVHGLSLAERLAECGYDCFVSELRGAGGSEQPAKGWTLGDYLAYDVPAILDCARAQSGHLRVSWIGHSLGGVMMMLYGIDHPDAPVARLVTVGSALDYRPGENVYRTLRPLRPLLQPILPSLPFAFLSQLNALVAGYGPRILAESMNFQRSNIDLAVMRRIMTRGFTSIPLRLLAELDTTFGDDGFKVPGRDAYLPRAGAFRIPTLMLGGSADPQCPEVATEASFALLRGAREKRRLTFGKAHGHADDYGHFDLLVGKRARTEVWPEIEAFLAVEAPSDRPLAPAAEAASEASA